MTFAGVSLMFLAKALKFWAIASLGTRWTYKVLVLPALPLVTDRSLSMDAPSQLRRLWSAS